MAGTRLPTLGTVNPWQGWKGVKCCSPTSSAFSGSVAFRLRGPTGRADRVHTRCDCPELAGSENRRPTAGSRLMRSCLHRAALKVMVDASKSPCTSRAKLYRIRRTVASVELVAYFCDKIRQRWISANRRCSSLSKWGTRPLVNASSFSRLRLAPGARPPGLAHLTRCAHMCSSAHPGSLSSAQEYLYPC
jgi:hypothetical protein